MNILETERTTVSRIVLDDAPFFVELLNSPDWLRFIGDRDVNNADEARDYLRNGFLRSYDENGFGYYIARMKLTALPFGICGFLQKPSLDNPDFGFALLPGFHDRGLAFEFGHAILEYGLQTFDFDVLDAVTKPDNIRSIRLLEKLGFRECEEGVSGDEDLQLFRRQTA